MKKNPFITENMAVVVMGLGLSGSAAVRYLHELGARVYVSDARPPAKLSSQEKQLLNECGAIFEGGGHTFEFLAQGELLFQSPGIPADLPVLKRIRETGMLIVGELALAAPVLECQVVAVTGTNGKTTVTTLIGEFLTATGREVFVCGNIGRPLLDCLRLDRQPDTAVVEVSSFQLEHCGTFKPNVAVLLNISPDHLDRHGSYSEYIKTKSNLFRNQETTDIGVLCFDDTLCLELGGNLKNVKSVSFGHNKVCESYICEAEIYLRWHGEMEIFDLSSSVFDNHIGRKNCAAAILAAKHAGASSLAIGNTLNTFQPLPHRMELVDTIDGVRFFNDSKATNSGAVVSALLQAPGKVILIAGGRDKGDDYSLLQGPIQQKVRLLILIGEAADVIAEQLEGVVAVAYAQSLEKAVRIAAQAAHRGESVLLSPACASFDMFTSYGHRGQVFKESVAKVKQNISQEETTG